MADGGPRRSRVHRWTGLVALSVRRVLASLGRRRPSRALVVVGVIAVAVAALVAVTGLSLGLASQPAVDDPGTEYWIAPESAGTLASLTTGDGPQLGDVHERSAALESHEEIARATPLLVEVLELRTGPGEPAEYVLAVGVIAPADGGDVAGLSTDEMTPGDPYHGAGHEDAFTGEVVLSPAAAELLGAGADDGLLVTRPGPGAVDQSFAVAGVAESEARTLQGDARVALFQLSELQRFTGADAGDQADQVLVRANSEAAVPVMEETFPDATVVERGGLSGGRLVDAELPLAVALSALVIVLVVTTLVVATAAGIDVEADRQRLAVLSALGFGSGSTSAIVAARTLTLAVLGGLVGAVLGGLCVLLLNHVVAPYYDLASFAHLSPALLAYGVGVAALAGLLAVPYPVLLARRTPALGELSG